MSPLRCLPDLPYGLHKTNHRCLLIQMMYFPLRMSSMFALSLLPRVNALEFYAGSVAAPLPFRELPLYPFLLCFLSDVESISCHNTLILFCTVKITCTLTADKFQSRTCTNNMCLSNALCADTHRNSNRTKMHTN